jgi:hypothetical protein
MTILPKTIYMFHTIPIKILMTFITEIEKSTLKFIWKHRRLNSQGNTEQEDQCWRYHNINFKLYYRVIAIKTSWYSYTHLIFDKVAKNIWWREDRLFNKCCWEKWLSGCRKLKLHQCLSLCNSINSKWIRDLNIRPEIWKLTQERTGNTLEAIGVGKDFLSRTQATQQLR